MNRSECTLATQNVNARRVAVRSIAWLDGGVARSFCRLRREIVRPRRGDEFLEAWIIPKRIKHRIEPEQRGSERRNLPEKISLLFRREGGDDFFEARIAAERVPKGEQL
jgi:hypothetical protein